MQVPQCLRLIGVTDPLFTALPGHFDFPGSRAVGLGQEQVFVTAGHTADLPILTGALVFAARLEGLSALVNDPVEHTVISFYRWDIREAGQGGKGERKQEHNAFEKLPDICAQVVPQVVFSPSLSY